MAYTKETEVIPENKVSSKVIGQFESIVGKGNVLLDEDQKQDYKTWLAYTLPGDRLKLAASLKKTHREGKTDNARAERDETTVLGDLQLLF